MRAAVAGALAAAVAGCGGGGGGTARKPSDSQVIRGWSAAVDAGDFGRAADYFAPGAVIQQVETVRLRSRADAVVFNRSLPCRADVTSIVRDGRDSLAS